MPQLLEPIYCSQQIIIPSTFPHILKLYAKAAIRTQPYDLLAWSAAYFRALSEGQVPPAKTRFETPRGRTPGGLTAGYLKLLINQLGGLKDVQSEFISRLWASVSLKDEELKQMMCLAGVYRQRTFPLYKIVAVAAGFLSKNLTQTMILLCELLSEEPEGGSAAIPSQLFIQMYTMLAEIDASKPIHYIDGVPQGKKQVVTEIGDHARAHKPSIWRHPKVQLSDRWSILGEMSEEFFEERRKTRPSHRLTEIWHQEEIVEAEDNESECCNSSQEKSLSDDEKIKYLKSSSEEKADDEPDVQSLNSEDRIISDIVEKISEIKTEEKSDEKKDLEDVKVIEDEETFDADDEDEGGNIKVDEITSSQSISTFNSSDVKNDDAKAESDGNLEVAASGDNLDDSKETVDVSTEGSSKPDEPEGDVPSPFPVAFDENGKPIIKELSDISNQDREAIIEQLMKNKEEKIKKMEDTMGSIEDLAEKTRMMANSIGSSIVDKVKQTSEDFISGEKTSEESSKHDAINKSSESMDSARMSVVDPKAKGVINPIFKGLFDNVAEQMAVVKVFRQEVKETFEEEIIVPAVPGIGPRVDADLMEEFLKYVRETAQEQNDMFMPRDMRHCLCPPMENLHE